MRRLFKISAVCFLGLLINAGCAHHSPERVVAYAVGPELPDHARWIQLKNFADTLNLADGATQLSLSKGGTSVYAVVLREGQAIGAVIPENSATSLSGEVMSYNIARALGVSHLYQEGVYFFVTGENLKVFDSIVPKTPFAEAKFKSKEENRMTLLNQIAKHPGGIDMIYKPWGAKPEDYDNLVRASDTSINGSHILEGSSKPFASFLKCQGPQPSAGVTVTMNEGTTSELLAAQELSSILLIDALTQQWDRFSGGNLQTTTVNGSVQFVAFDNGGTWGGPKWTQRSLGMVSRFDRKVVREILDMNMFVNEGAGSYRGFRTEQELIAAFGIEHFPRYYANFKQSLALVAQHLRKNADCYFQ